MARTLLKVGLCVAILAGAGNLFAQVVHDHRTPIDGQTPSPWKPTTPGASGPAVVVLQNYWKPDEYVNIQQGPAVAGAIRSGWLSARWTIEPVPGSVPVSYRLRNVWKPDQYLNIESGALVAGPIQPGWLSAIWAVEPVPGTVPTLHRFRNVWKPDQCLNNQNGALVAGPVQPGWWSAMWVIAGPETVPVDAADAAVASQAEIDDFNDVKNNQLGVGVLGGESTYPIYYHANKPNEVVYKYRKLIDPSRLPGALMEEITSAITPLGAVLTPATSVTDLAADIVQWAVGSHKAYVDCWYPTSEHRTTMCGTMNATVFSCGQDYIHTKVTQDKDLNFDITPSPRFNSMLTNRWIKNKTYEVIEGEVKATNLQDLDTHSGNTAETLTPHNPLLMDFKAKDNVCLYGPWMADILDINASFGVPATTDRIPARVDLRKNNEIHPINQMWRRKGDEIQLVSIVDGTGYFKNIGNNEVQASGLSQRMRFYVAFEFAARETAVTPNIEYDVNGVSFDLTGGQGLSDFQPHTVTLKYDGATRVKINDNSVMRTQPTHHVFFDKVRARPDHKSIQGYIVVETDAIAKPGGSINIFMKDLTPNGSFVNASTTTTAKSAKHAHGAQKHK